VSRQESRVETNNLQEEIQRRLLGSGADLVGFADISGVRSSINLEQLTAVAIGIAYDSAVVDRLDSEIEAFETHLADTKDEMETVLEVCVQCLRQRDFKAWIHFSKDLPGLLSDFSHKMAATKAGLGWIGRSSLLVSSEFGCGIRLATVLTNAAFTPGTPVTESRCGDCTECVKACPYGAIRGAAWFPAIERDELLDAFLCSRKREEHISRLGYKHPCGLCIKACPVGKMEA